MTCRELVEFLMEYDSDALPAGQREEFEFHLTKCPPCKCFLETYRETIRLGKKACCDEDGPVPEQVPEELIQAILAARKVGDDC
jgi:anti-sigma factor RsiW